MANQVSEIKSIVLDYVCGAGADVLACTLEGTDVVLYVLPAASPDLVQRLARRLQDAFVSNALEVTVSVRCQHNAVIASGITLYNPLGHVMHQQASAPSARWGSVAAAAMMALGGLTAPLAFAGAMPAVSAPNGKVDIDTNNYDGTEGNVAKGSFSLPLGHDFGVQLDGAAGEVINESYSGVGAHVFWRDPDKGLVGAIASTARLDGEYLSRVGAEAKAYLGQFSLNARGERQNGDVDRGDVARLGASWYVTDNVMLDAYSERAASQMTNRVTVEWQPEVPSMPGLALFATSARGSDSLDSTSVGVRYYFGTNKSLKNRHRQDDPESLVPDGSSALIDRVYQKRVNVVPNCYGYGCVL